MEKRCGLIGLASTGYTCSCSTPGHSGLPVGGGMAKSWLVHDRVHAHTGALPRTPKPRRSEKLPVEATLRGYQRWLLAREQRMKGKKK